MSQSIPEPRLTKEGVVFTVVVESLGRECLIREEALHKLSTMKNIDTSESGNMAIFQAFEGSIKGVARRLVAAGVKGNPLVMTPNTFFTPPRAS